MVYMPFVSQDQAIVSGTSTSGSHVCTHSHRDKNSLKACSSSSGPTSIAHEPSSMAGATCFVSLTRQGIMPYIVGAISCTLIPLIQWSSQKRVFSPQCASLLVAARNRSFASAGTLIVRSARVHPLKPWPPSLHGHIQPSEVRYP
mgnify:CR=1 FL=1